MNSINGSMFKGMLESAANNLNNERTVIDSLNVFPVPDGDTGTNMSMTFTNGVNEVINLGSDDLSSIAKALSRGLLMGARGNSGVILSQIFRGFYQDVNGKSEITATDFASAMWKGTTVAYKAVMKPVEGTILTVVRESSEYAKMFVEAHPDCSVEEYMDVLVKEAHTSLENTPELLPVLKEVGVVDSGGTGLTAVFEGFKAYLHGCPIALADGKNAADGSTQAEIENEEFGYCTEFILRLSKEMEAKFSEEKLRHGLSKLGNSLVVVHDDDLVKVHVHTLTPGDALNLGQRYGEFVKIKVENMQEQHNNLTGGAEDKSSDALKADEEPKEYALVAVSAGEGLDKLFKEYRVDIIVSGGQTMNPSTEDFVNVIKNVNARHIFVLPNNSNIIMAAKQAALLMEDKDITVFETKTISQGLSACIMFNPEADKNANISEMEDAIHHVKSGQLTYAIKDTSYEGLQIRENDYMGILDKAIVVAEKDKMTAAKALIDKMMDDDSEIVTLIYGEGTTMEEAQSLASYIEEKYSAEVEIHNGKQPVYSYFISVE